MQTIPTGFSQELFDLLQNLSQSCNKYIDQKFDQCEEKFRKKLATVLEIESAKAFDAADQFARDTEEQLKHTFYEAHQDFTDDLQAERGITEKSIETLVSSLVVQAKRNIRRNARKERESLQETFETLVQELAKHRENTVRQKQANLDGTSDVHVVCEDAVADSDTTTEDEGPPWKRRRLEYATATAPAPSCDVATSPEKKEEFSAHEAAPLVADSSSLHEEEAPSPRFASQERQTRLADSTPWGQNRDARAGSAPP